MKNNFLLKNVLTISTIFAMQGCIFPGLSPDPPIEPSPFPEPTTAPIDPPQNALNAPNLFKFQFGPGTKGLKQEFGPGSKGLSKAFGPGSKGLKTPFGPGTKGLGRIFYSVNFKNTLLRTDNDLSDFTIQSNSTSLEIDSILVTIYNQNEIMAQASFLPKASQIIMDTQLPSGEYTVKVEAEDNLELFASETSSITINEDKKSELRVELSAKDLTSRDNLDINILTRTEK